MLNNHSLHTTKNAIKKYNVAFIHEQFPFGGGEIVTSTIASYLTRKDYNVFVFAYQINQNLLTEQDKKHITTAVINKNDLFESPITDTNLIIKNIKKLNIDIIVFCGCIDFNVIGIVNASRCKSVFAYHGMPFWEIENKKSHLLKRADSFSFFRKWRYLNYKIPKILKNEDREIRENFLSIHKTCDAFTVLCSPYEVVFRKELQLEQSQKIHTISNTISPPPITYSQKKKKQLLYLGRMSYSDKRVDRLIDIWKNIYHKFPDWEFVLVGDGEERQNLETQAKSYKLERIKFCGSTNQPHQYYNEASILCMSSQFEGIPLVLLEAQQAGVIPIAFNCSSGVESVLSPSWMNGVLIDGFSLTDYENALCMLMSDENLRLGMQESILKKSQDFSVSQIGELWHRLFEGIL